MKVNEIRKSCVYHSIIDNRINILMTFNRITTETESDQICFINYTLNYCICIIDIVNSTRATVEIINP